MFGQGQQSSGKFTKDQPNLHKLPNFSQVLQSLAHFTKFQTIFRKVQSSLGHIQTNLEKLRQVKSSLAYFSHIQPGLGQVQPSKAKFSQVQQVYPRIAKFRKILPSLGQVQKSLAQFGRSLVKLPDGLDRDLWSKGVSLILEYLQTLLSFCVLNDFFFLLGFCKFLVPLSVVSVLLSAQVERCFVSRMRILAQFGPILAIFLLRLAKLAMLSQVKSNLAKCSQFFPNLGKFTKV